MKEVATKLLIWGLVYALPSQSLYVQQNPEMTHLWDKSRTYQEAHHNSYLIPCAKQCSYGITVLAPFQPVLGVHWQLHSKRPGTRWKKCIPQRPFSKGHHFFSKHASSNSQVVSSNSWFVICSKMGFLKLPLLYEQHPLSSTPTITFFFEHFWAFLFENVRNLFERVRKNISNI